eukprot:jgi/Chlat1/9184/Chrsp97S09285
MVAVGEGEGEGEVEVWRVYAALALQTAAALAVVAGAIALVWFAAWKLVLRHVPLVQEITGRKKKKPKITINKPPRRHPHLQPQPQQSRGDRGLT